MNNLSYAKEIAKRGVKFAFEDIGMILSATITKESVSGRD